ncbi:MAG: hypothetical protein O2856_02465 [Planctomycetota bacterium]|nr:hypothetical protein [Planctomycetota bacterium]
MLGDLKNSRVIIVKGFLFLLTGFIATGLLLVDHPNVRTGLLLLIMVWSSCRFYYFAFYVIQHYVDPTYHFSGLISFLQYLWNRRKNSGKQS